MFKVGEIVVYKKEVCKIKEIKEKYIQNKDYYIMNPIKDETLLINAPIDNEKNLREVITKEEAKKVIANISNIEPLDINNKNIEFEYKQLLNEDSLENLIKIIKTSYLRNKERIDNNKKNYW